jgi:hypothetical protein
LAVCAGTPIGLVIALAAWPRVRTATDVVFVLANWVLAYCVFALVAFGERARQRRLRGPRDASRR